MLPNWHKIILVVLLLSAGILVACIGAAEPAKPRDFDITDLFLPLEVFPGNWQEVGRIRAMGPDSPIGIGDPDDTYLSYKTRQAPTNHAYYYVYRNDSTAAAERWFAAMRKSEFEDDRATIVEPWSIPQELSYRSTYAGGFYAACATIEITSQRVSCQVIAQYEEFGVVFHSVVEPEILSLQDFNRIVCHIDALFVARLELSSQPIECQ